jgi:hypothetical protein
MQSATHQPGARAAVEDEAAPEVTDTSDVGSNKNETYLSLPPCRPDMVPAHRTCAFLHGILYMPWHCGDELVVDAFVLAVVSTMAAPSFASTPLQAVSQIEG